MKMTATVPALAITEFSGASSMAVQLSNHGDGYLIDLGIGRYPSVKIDKKKLRAALDALDLVEAKQ